MWNPFATREAPPRDDLVSRVEVLERRFTNLQLEWTEVLDKVLHRLQRQAKRDRDAVASAAGASDSSNGDRAGVDVPLHPGTRKDALRARLRGLRVRG